MTRPKIFHAADGPVIRGQGQVQCFCGRRLHPTRTRDLADGRLCKQCQRKMDQPSGDGTMMSEPTVAPSLPPTQWHPQIHRRAAEKAGLTPSDFTWLEYPISDVTMALPVADARHQTVLFHTSISPETPQVNQYFRADERDPDKAYKRVMFGDDEWWSLQVTGTALAWVSFSLVDMADGEVLATSTAAHDKGKVLGGPGSDAPLWKRLTPGATLTVRLEAYPRFFPYCNPDTGDGGNHYSVGGRGYLWGETVMSPTYELTMTPHGLPEPPHLLLDGLPAPEPQEFQLKGAAEGQAFHEWLSGQRRAITAKDSWVTAENMAGQVGMDPERYASIEAGTIEPEDWERHNIEDAIKGWQQAYGL